MPLPKHYPPIPTVQDRSLCPLPSLPSRLSPGSKSTSLYTLMRMRSLSTPAAAYILMSSLAFLTHASLSKDRLQFVLLVFADCQIIGDRASTYRASTSVDTRPGTTFRISTPKLTACRYGIGLFVHLLMLPSKYYRVQSSSPYTPTYQGRSPTALRPCCSNFVTSTRPSPLLDHKMHPAPSV